MSRIYTPRFATLALVENVGGAGGSYVWNPIFYLAKTPPLPGPRLVVDIGTYITDRTETDPTPICLRFSCPPELDGQDRLREVATA